MDVRASACYPPACASIHCTAQHVAMPTMSILHFREENFRDQKSNHEFHENIVPRKFGAIRYYIGGSYRPVGRGGAGGCTCTPLSDGNLQTTACKRVHFFKVVASLAIH